MGGWLMGGWLMGGWPIGVWRSVSGLGGDSSASATAPARSCLKRLLELENCMLSVGGLGVSSKGSGVRPMAVVLWVAVGVRPSAELGVGARLGKGPGMLSKPGNLANTGKSPSSQSGVTSGGEPSGGLLRVGLLKGGIWDGGGTRSSNQLGVPESHPLHTRCFHCLRLSFLFVKAIISEVSSNSGTCRS